MRVLWRAVRWLVVGVVLVAALILFPVLRVTVDKEARSIQDTVAQAKPPVLLLAMGATALWIVMLGFLIRESAVAVGRPVPVGRGILLALALQFVNAFPAGSLARIVYETRAIERMGVPRAPAMLIVGVETVVFFSTFMILLFIGLALLAVVAGPSLWEITLAILLAVILGGVTIAGLVTLGDPVRAAALRERLIRWFGEGRGIGRSFDEVSLATQRIREAPSILAKPALAAAAHWSASLLVLTLVFFALGLSPSPALVVAGFSISFLVGSLTPIPAGLGAVDVTLAVLLAGLGLDPSAAVTVTILFRVLTLLIPAILGIFAHHVLVQMSEDLDRVVPVTIRNEVDDAP
jgi:uncharacterized protein (TIRG00374 family)